MRLDVFLKISRLVTRRSLAQELCEAGRVSVNGAAARSSKSIREGDIVSLDREGMIVSFRVERIPAAKQLSKAEAALLISQVSPNV